LDDGALTQEDYLKHIELAYELHSRVMELSAQDAMSENMNAVARLAQMKMDLRDFL